MVIRIYIQKLVLKIKVNTASMREIQLGLCLQTHPCGSTCEIGSDQLGDHHRERRLCGAKQSIGLPLCARVDGEGGMYDRLCTKIPIDRRIHAHLRKKVHVVYGCFPDEWAMLLGPFGFPFLHVLRSDVVTGKRPYKYTAFPSNQLGETFDRSRSVRSQQHRTCERRCKSKTCL